MRSPEIVRDGARDHTRPLASTSDVPTCRIAIIGPNGAGKSTLLKLILNKEQPSEGRAEIVAANAVTQYFEQDQANALPLDYTVLQCLEDAASDTRCDHYDNQSSHHRLCNHTATRTTTGTSTSSFARCLASSCSKRRRCTTRCRSSPAARRRASPSAG